MYIQIRNDIFTLTNNETIIHTIKPRGFTILSYIIYKSHNTNYAQISPKEIMEFINMHPSKTKEMIGLISSIIQCFPDITTNINLTKINKNSIILFDLTNYRSKLKSKDNTNNIGYESISGDIFITKYKTISDIGWCILCLLSKLHNINFGSETSYGFAEPSEQYISQIINCDRKTINKYTQILEQENLIKIKPKENILYGYDIFGRELYKSVPKKYIINNVTQKNKR